jgi:inosine-uridine nucleoside N-ribohydrolase
MRPFLPLLFPFLLCTCAPSPKEATPEIPQAPKHEWPTGKSIKLILDSDTANEIDDLFAIAYLLTGKYPGFELLGLSSAQWFHVWSGDSTVYQSQQLNEEILALAGREDLPHPLGADLIMGKPWGGYAPRDSPAARFIINQAMALPASEKLAVLGIGATTNLASAIALRPEIKDRIVAYTLGFRYDFDGKFWNKDEFNIRRDLNAANYLLNAEGLELHIMPISVAEKYRWEREKTFAQLAKAGEMGEYLRRRWAYHAPNAEQWTMWDVALLQAFLKPVQAAEISVLTPPENKRRAVWMYRDIDNVAMENDFWSVIR